MSRTVEMKINTDAIVEAVREQVIKYFAERLYPAVVGGDGPDAACLYQHACGGAALGKIGGMPPPSCPACGLTGRWSQLYVWED